MELIPDTIDFSLYLKETDAQTKVREHRTTSAS